LAAGSRSEEGPVSKTASWTLYRGQQGQWAWVAHRITGVAIFLVHVLDTSMVRVSPAAYNAVIGTYKNPIMGIGEAGLVAAVVFHAFGGVRINFIDFWKKGPKYHVQMREVSPTVYCAAPVRRPSWPAGRRQS
jgi:succinate dehydrogenase / fumarate reductase cytochrome b subunit